MYFNGGTMTANFAGLAVPPLRVAVAQNEDGTYNADHTLAQILDAYDNGNAVYCQYGNMVLSLEMISKAFCSFACVHSGNVHTVHIGLSSVNVTTAPVVKTVNGTAPDENGNVELDIPSGGGGGVSSSGGVFRVVEIMEKDGIGYTLKLPVNWGKIVQFNFNCVPKLSGDAKVEMRNGGNYRVIGDLSSNTKSFNIYGIQYWHDMFSQPYFTCGLAVASNAEDTARPLIPAASMAAAPNCDEIYIYTVGGAAVFQAGTKFEMWGAYTA
jgi:hypothetical protein